MKIANIIIFTLFLCISLCFLYSNVLNKKNRVDKKSMFSNKVYKVFLFGILIVGIFVRVYKFGEVPGGFNQDGAMAVVDGIALAEYGTDRYGMFMPVHLTAWGYGQMSSLLSYLIAFFVNIFGFSTIIVRLPILIISLISSICFYLFVRDIFGKDISLIAAFFLTINPWHIMQSRWILDCNLFPHFLMIGIYLLNRGINKKIYLMISMIFFGLSMYCYGISIYTVPVFLLGVCIYLIKMKKVTFKDALFAFLIFMLISWPFILTMIINFFKVDTIKTPFFTIPFFENSVRSSDILFFSDNILSQLFINIAYLIKVVVFQIKDLPWNDIEGFGTMYKFSIPFIILGVYLILKKHKKSSGAIILFMFFLTGIWCGITTNYVNINRINIIFYPLIILLSIGVYDVIKYFKNFKWIIMVVYIVTFLIFSSNYFTTYQKSISKYFFKDFGDALISIKDSDAEKFYITADVQYEGSSDVSEILTMFYHEIDAKYYQGKVLIDNKSFKDKYVFSSIKNLKINPLEDAIYVITENDLRYFDKENFSFSKYGSYYVVGLKN